MDAGLAGPLYNLMQRDDVEVQTAATAVVCNVVLEYSPMREVGSTRWGNLKHANTK